MTLEIDGLVKAYEGFELGPLDLTVGREVVSVLGPSGCGKTTLLWSIAGIVRPDGGRISLDGRSLLERPPEARRTGLVFQDGALFPNMTARENIAYASSDRDRVEELAETFEIEDVLDRRPRTLSGGEQQRVALARTLATDPDALLLDEPLSSLDAPIRRRLRNELHDVFDSLAIPVILVTHDQRTATALGDRILVLRDGLVEQIGSASEIVDRPKSEFVARFTGNENVFEAEVRSQNGETVELRVEDVTLLARADRPVESVVSACVHPSRVQLQPRLGDSAPGSEGGAVGGGNSLRGTVRRWLNEGDGYRVVVAIDGAGLVLTATVPPPRFEQLSIEPGSSVRTVIAPSDVHLIGPLATN